MIDLASARTVESALAVAEAAVTIRFPYFVAVHEENAIVTLRGILGYGLAAKLPKEEYRRVFKGGVDSPPPFLIDAFPGVGGARVLQARLRVFGDVPLALYLDAFAEHGVHGYGSEGVPYSLTWRIDESTPLPWSDGWEQPPHDIGERVALRVTLTTPAQLKYRGMRLEKIFGIDEAVDDPVAVSPPQLLLHSLVWSGLRRLKALSAESRVMCEINGEWVKNTLDASVVERFSLHRHHRAQKANGVPLGGITGFIEVDAPAGLARLLAIAESIGIGGNVATGNGRVAVTHL